ncbi:hypothetical protein J8631_09990 [Serratia fonticola]|uniref:Rap1a/Tai family immunity protein n=1 Tax=Serratia fonticola TaxID=47917 RepID=UPI001AE196CA|nr:Rap1a/Tai family immunity protein [Serratia fonticola]MBP1035890.1 hypothetical protein [Serratia fonticola]
MKWIVSVLLAMAPAFATAAPSDLDSGNDYYSLYQTWKSEDSSKIEKQIAKSMLYAHTKAIINAYTDMGTFCPPDGATYGQSIDIIIEYLKKKPATRNEDISFISLKALHSTFSCKDKTS